MPEPVREEGDVIRASEIGLYVFCARAWRLRSEGYASANSSEMTAGTEAHAAHGWRVTLYDLARRASIVLVLLAAAALALWWLAR